MSTKGPDNPNGRRRRSPRLATAVEVKIAARGEDGAVLVETTRTRDISKNGASLASRNSFPVGSPIAIRRPGAQPMRGRVVSVKPDGEPGLVQVGVEVLEDDVNWDLQFPKDWQDSDHSGNGPNESNDDSSEARRRIHAEDRALEALVRKAESLRNLTERMLSEFAVQADAARRQNVSALAAQVESFSSWKNVLECEASAQVRLAAETVRTEAGLSRAALERHAAALREKADEIHRQSEAGLSALEESYQQTRVKEGQKAAEIIARVAAQVEAQRKAAAELEAQAGRFQAETALHLNHLREGIQNMIQGAAGEIQAAALAGVKDYRERIPELGKEVERFFASIMEEQHSTAGQWIEGSMENLRAGMVELEKKYRLRLEEDSRQSQEQYRAGLKDRLMEFREMGQAAASPLEARLEQTRAAAEEQVKDSERAVAAAREQLSAAAKEAEGVLAKATAKSVAEMGEEEAKSRRSLEKTRESLQLSALEAARGLDQTALDLKEMSAGLGRQAGQKRQELEGLFASLMSMYDHRKEALDRLLETLESGRAALRDGLESLRVNSEENQARIERFTAEREAALKLKAEELQQQLQSAAVNLEAELRERGAAALESSHQAFSARLEQVSALAGRKFEGLIEKEMNAAAERIPELMRALDQCEHEHSQTLAAETSVHAENLAEARAAIERQMGAALENVARRAAQGEEALKQAAAAAAGALEDQRVKAAGAVREPLAALEQQRLTLARLRAEAETWTQQWRESIEMQFATLSEDLDQKRASLEAVHSSFAEQVKSTVAKNITGLDWRREEALTTLEGYARQLKTSLDKQAAAVSAETQEKLRTFTEGVQQEVVAVKEAAEGVFQAHIGASAQQALASAERLMEQSANAAALALDRTIQNERKEHELRIQELGRQSGETLREKEQALRNSAAAVASSLEEEMRRIFRGMMEQWKTSQESFSREIPARMTETEAAFRQNLERIQEQFLAAASEALRGMCAQSIARSELELSQKCNEILAMAPSAGNSGQDS